MLEKGRFTPAAELPLTERESFQEMYEMGSLLTTQDAGARKHDPKHVLLWSRLATCITAF